MICGFKVGKVLANEIMDNDKKWASEKVSREKLSNKLYSERTNKLQCHPEAEITTTKITAGTLEVRYDKSLTFLTFDI